MADHSEGDDKDQKVVRLRPAGLALAGPQREAPEPSVEEQIAAVERELKDVMGYARTEAIRADKGPRVPKATHRNAVRCPECDELTWRRTQHCIHCRADLAELAAERDERRREAWRGAFWLIAIASWALAPMCLYMAQHYALPPPLHRAFNWTGGAIIAINAAVLWYSSLDKRR